ncbi:flagellar basal body P-ring protein FlgI [Buchnera aphidicola (Hyadaphis tataricae)]|uniref:Flagellar P-ring protein n=1 Tax=Buchnera aphidicola (Hyadaphis tataricae) TaxID=1241859 RepID=A0A4D6Y6G0_9GAMM|nr:flagellar basal body P-ring protein FlgI [Buchnera aphidicola]QCI21641.1 flagellar basal body P-ring protein FlgI [Buchnera aphidicola (Hyadaphis tataricae)]
MSKIILLIKIIICTIISVSLPSYAEKIRDLTSIQGIRDNQLIGYGLIVGLNGTGDQSTQAPFTKQSLNNMLSQLGVAVPPNINMHLRNVAAVIVTANLPPFSHTGEKIDIKVASIGNAKSLKGGTLLMTPLKGTDNQIYAIAQGEILTSEKHHLEKRMRYLRDNQENSGTINNGATIEREVHTTFGKNNTINLQLNEENFSTAQRISDMINIKYPDTATPINSKTVQLNTSANNNVQVHMLSNIQDIDVSLPDQEAKVLVNPRTGSVVMNQSVKLGSCIVSNGNISIMLNEIINKNKDFDFLKLFKKNQTKKNISDASINKNYMDRISLNKVNLNHIIQSLNLLGTRSEELISILQLMKNAGCLNAKLEIV